MGGLVCCGSICRLIIYLALNGLYCRSRLNNEVYTCMSVLLVVAACLDWYFLSLQTLDAGLDMAVCQLFDQITRHFTEVPYFAPGRFIFIAWILFEVVGRRGEQDVGRNSQALEWKKNPRLILRWSDSVIHSHFVLSYRKNGCNRVTQASVYETILWSAVQYSTEQYSIE